MCRTFSKFSSAQVDDLKKDVTGLCSLMGGSVDTAAVVAKKTDGPDLPLGSGSLRPVATTGPSSSVTFDAGVVYASVP